MPGVLVERPRRLDLAGKIIEEPSSDLSSILISYSRTSDMASPYSQSVSGDLGRRYQASLELASKVPEYHFCSTYESPDSMQRGNIVSVSWGNCMNHREESHQWQPSWRPATFITMRPRNFKMPNLSAVVFFWGGAVLCLHCYMGFSLAVASGGYFLVALHRLLIEAASVFAEHRL